MKIISHRKIEINFPISCPFCTTSIKEKFVFSKHLKKYHNKNIEEWYIEKYLNNKNPKCLNCDNNVEYKNGYFKNFCSKKCKYQSSSLKQQKKTEDVKQRISVETKMAMKRIDVRNKYLQGIKNRKTNIPIWTDNMKEQQRIKQIGKKRNSITCQKIGLSKIGQIAWNKNKKWDKEQKNKMSSSHKKNWENGIYDNRLTKGGKCKWYDYVKKDGNVVKCQGTWELKYAKYLDNNNIDFVSHKKMFYYSVGDDVKRYFPDFYILKDNKFVEIKNPYLLDKQKQKFNEIIKQNPDINLEILSKTELVNLGVL